jgi:hypothetical protein
MGMAMLVAVPLLSLILIRLLWSGSSLWFLTAGILLLGSAAVVYLLRRPPEMEPVRPGTATGGGIMDDNSKAPIILAGLGVLFLAMLLMPNFAGDSDDNADSLALQQDDNVSEVSGVTTQNQQPAAQQPAAQQPAAPTDGETYAVQDGDTLWDIAVRFDTTVEAIVEANPTLNPEALTVGEEITIPAPEPQPVAP